VPRPRTGPVTWREYTAVCITCRRLRLRAGAFPDRPEVIAHGRDREIVLAYARDHERLCLGRDRAHAIEIRTRDVTVRPVGVAPLGEVERAGSSEAEEWLPSRSLRPTAGQEQDDPVGSVPPLRRADTIGGRQQREANR